MVATRGAHHAAGTETGLQAAQVFKPLKFKSIVADLC